MRARAYQLTPSETPPPPSSPWAREQLFFSHRTKRNTFDLRRLRTARDFACPRVDESGYAGMVFYRPHLPDGRSLVIPQLRDNTTHNLDDSHVWATPIFFLLHATFHNPLQFPTRRRLIFLFLGSRRDNVHAKCWMTARITRLQQK